ncbi:unnamed protein product [Malassezia sympodialis ATCC 42132]|uniref:uncharacterized protein n=1 Tax=Malassezia sympodialis (strain ATCC 42132) TaxID=1230383 RepID=UPI0002C223BD|nr:uncharacterized protein MSY001_1775 [Malassezia sympodialis ATCC 42132]CCU99069.1 unnamed protein product [Malassezia sympodialis ATCC 42132]|eukprot:XP_018740337.1 uncharacterized protein MSY001_1775 [Malassezia sympodialis ATCC 42132]
MDQVGSMANMESSVLRGPNTSSSLNNTVIMPWGSAYIKEDIVRIVTQWLADEGFGAARQALLEEAGLNLRESEDEKNEKWKLRTCLLGAYLTLTKEGNWAEVEKICAKPFFKGHKAFLYAIYRQQFLEIIEHREYQKAFTFLTKRLKPLEHYQPHAAEFGDLCYLLSAKSVTDAPSFRMWEGIQPGREALVAEFSPLLEPDRLDREALLDDAPGAGSKPRDQTYVPPHRLLTLLHQAVAYQVEFARYQKRTVPVVSSLLHDYAGFVIPNRCRMALRGHTQNVKCLRFVGEDGRKLVSGSSDCTVRLWDTETGGCDAILEGHGSRVWDVDATRNGALLASASSDATVRIWSTESKLPQLTLRGGFGDVYCCRFSPSQHQLVTGGYDKLIRLYDLNNGTAVRMFPGHQLGVSSAVFSPQGSLVITGAKDTSVRFWDTLSGTCVRSLPGHLGEVTSVEMSDDGMQLLTSSKDNSHRLWDMRMLRPLQRFKGHQNTSKNFIRCAFAHPSLIVSGSEDGLVYMWGQENSRVLQTLEGHGIDAPLSKSTPEWCTATDGPTHVSRKQVVVYSTVWNKVQGLLASCADDGTVRVWDWTAPHDTSR